MGRTSDGAAVLRNEDSGEVETSYRCVVVRTWDGVPLRVQAPPNSTLVTIPGPGDSAGDLWVDTADQWGPFAVTTRLWDRHPGEPDPEWEDVVEVNIESATGLFATEMVDNEPQVELTSEPGTFRMRVSARGRAIPARDDEGDDLGDNEDFSPKEWYLLEAWPLVAGDDGRLPAPEIVRLTSPYAQHMLNPPAPAVLPEGEAGLAAAARIGRDIDRKPGARAVSGVVGSVRVERRTRGTRQRLFRLCAHLTSWSHLWVEGGSWMWAGGRGADGDAYALNVPRWAFSDDHADQLTGEHGAVRCSFVEVKKPQLAVRQWDWLVNPGSEPVPVDERVPFLQSPTLITVTLTQSRDDAGEPWTTIAIEHDGLPAEWLDDMETYWNYQLAIAEHARLGVKE